MFQISQPSQVSHPEKPTSPGFNPQLHGTCFTLMPCAFRHVVGPWKATPAAGIRIELLVAEAIAYALPPWVLGPPLRDPPSPSPTTVAIFLLLWQMT